MSEIIIFTAFILIVAMLLGLSAERHVRYRKTLNKFLQAELDRLSLSQNLLDAHNELEGFRLGETEEFVKFLSTSRQWAFDFIDEYQQALIELFAILNDPSIDTNEADALEKFQSLKRFLPKDG